jgi:hypothetical protein
MLCSGVNIVQWMHKVHHPNVLPGSLLVFVSCKRRVLCVQPTAAAAAATAAAAVDPAVLASATTTCALSCPPRVLKVFDWVNLPAATAWGWVLQPSAGYIGQGMIMGPKTAWSMMAGAVTGVFGNH